MRLRHNVKAELASPESLSISIPPAYMLFHLWSCAMQTRDPLHLSPPHLFQCNAISPINSSGFSQRRALDKRAHPSEVGHFRNVEEEVLLGD